MSLRYIRKINGGIQLPAPECSSDEENYEPVCTQQHDRSLYEGLEVSSESETNDVDEVEPAPEEPKLQKVKKNKNNKKKKKRRVKNEMDEIDRSIQEINEQFGVPEKLPEVELKKDLEKIKSKLFTVKQQFLDPKAELNRRFGPDLEEEPKKRGRQPNLRNIAKRGNLIGTDTVFKKNGMTMNLKSRCNGITHFAFNHSQNYQNLHNIFLYSHEDNSIAGLPRLIFPLEESQRRMHVEGLLETADKLYLMEEYKSGNKVIEDIIAYMQHCAHPLFSITNIRMRLQYVYAENRAFHIALLKYLHMLTNKACHRTALEIGKILLNLDPSDPLAVLFIIDAVAVRAREFQWLIEAVEYWVEDRDANFLFNMQYSYALATFQVALKNKEKDPNYKKRPKTLSFREKAVYYMAIHAKFSKYKFRLDREKAANGPQILPEDDKAEFEKADVLIKDAILRFPAVLMHIFKNAGIRNEKVKECALFKSDGSAGSKLNNLTILYARFVWHRFTEEAPKKWLVRNAIELVEKYETDMNTQEVARTYAKIRMDLFQTYPQQIKRHLSILTPFNKLLDGEVPDIGLLVSYDPAPPRPGISPYDDYGADAVEDNDSSFEAYTGDPPDHEQRVAMMEGRQDVEEMDQVALEPEHIHFAPSESESEDGDENYFRRPRVNISQYTSDLSADENVRLYAFLYNTTVRMPNGNMGDRLSLESATQLFETAAFERSLNMEESLRFTAPRDPSTELTDESDKENIPDLVNATQLRSNPSEPINAREQTVRFTEASGTNLVSMQQGSSSGHSSDDESKNSFDVISGLAENLRGEVVSYEKPPFLDKEAPPTSNELPHEDSNNHLDENNDTDDGEDIEQDDDTATYGSGDDGDDNEEQKDDDDNKDKENNGDNEDIEEDCDDTENADDGNDGDGNTGDGGNNDGATNDGPTNDGATNDGATNGGATDDGATNDGATNDGATNDGATNGGATNGGATNGGATNDGATNDGATNGGATNGGATNDGATNDGDNNVGEINDDETNADDEGDEKDEDNVDDDDDYYYGFFYDDDDDDENTDEDDEDDDDTDSDDYDEYNNGNNGDGDDGGDDGNNGGDAEKVKKANEVDIDEDLARRFGNLFI